MSYKNLEHRKGCGHSRTKIECKYTYVYIHTHILALMRLMSWVWRSRGEMISSALSLEYGINFDKQLPLIARKTVWIVDHSQPELGEKTYIAYM